MKYFKLDEFKCPCCALNLSKDLMLKKIDQARELAGIPFVVLSSTRCPKHNKEVGGEDESTHLDGWAVDIKAITSQQKYKIIKALISVGCTRIGVYKTFIHADFAPDKPQNVIWYG